MVITRWGDDAEFVAQWPLLPSTREKTIRTADCLPWWAVGVLYASLLCVICVICGSGAATAAQKPHHAGTKLEGYATVVTPNTITVFDKKSGEIEILTDKDYTSLVGIAAPVTVWYTTEGGVNHLEDIVYPTKAATFVPSDTILNNIKRIIILPQPEGVDNSDGLIGAISTYLTENAGLFVAPPELALEIASRNGTSASSLDAIDPNTGAVDMQRYLEPQRLLVSKIAEETRSDAVLEVSVIKVKAKVRSSVASWDDMSEPVASRKTRTLSPFSMLGGNGWVYAATADMSLWGHDGKLLWKRRRGFAVLALQTGIGAKYRERPLTDVYQDQTAMQRWLGETLGQMAPPIRGIPAESPQLLPDIQKQLPKTN